jgi:hypothetical protein
MIGFSRVIIGCYSFLEDPFVQFLHLFILPWNFKGKF